VGTIIKPAARRDNIPHAELLSNMAVELAALKQRGGQIRALKQGRMQESLIERIRLL